MKLRSLRENCHAVIDLGVVLMIGIGFAGMAVLAYVIFTLKDQLWTAAPSGTTSAEYNMSYYQAGNITDGFDNAIALILIAITIWILALAISALLMLRGRE